MKFRWPWHKHRQVVQSIQLSEEIHPQVAMTMMLSGKEPPKSRTTIALWRCPCGEIGTFTVLGHWTLEQIQGKPSLDATDMVKKLIETQ